VFASIKKAKALCDRNRDFIRRGRRQNLAASKTKLDKIVGILISLCLNNLRHRKGQVAVSAPVRAVESSDGQHLFVAARGRNTKFPVEKVITTSVKIYP
jgi:hypothetical protein